MTIEPVPAHVRGATAELILANDDAKYREYVSWCVVRGSPVFPFSVWRMIIAGFGDDAQKEIVESN